MTIQQIKGCEHKMCGITGWVDWEANLLEQERIIKTMTETLRNRGPDAYGIWLSDHAAFGHRRLSVVDPEGGSQPMIRQKEKNKYTITYNGELYNTSELRNELKSLGYTFTTYSDTEVLLISYIEWGPECINRLNGIYAFGIWDEQKQNLFLARDRFGVKPLFYSKLNNGLIFGSEIKSLLAHPAIEPEIDIEGIMEIFFIGPARTPGCGVYRGINELKPAHYLIYDRNGIKIKRYWSFKSQPHLDDLDTTAFHLRELLQDSIERQLVADVPVCTFLSGGIDSSTITVFAVEGFKKKGLNELHTYSIDYIDNDKYFQPNDFQPNSDSYWVKQVSDSLGTKHHNITVDTPQLVEALVTAVKAKDLPGMADIDSSLYLFCKEVKKKATVALSGECADEIFGGYPWFHREDLLKANTFPWSISIDLRKSILSPAILSLITPEEYISERYKETLKEVPRLEGENPLDARRREMFYLNITWFMTTLLDRKDRMSMATGLEVRVPFCDHRLAEYVWNIPWEMKIYQQREKGILRYALKGILPNEVLERKKSPYPKTHNPSYLTAVRKWLLDILDDPTSPIHILIDTKTVRSMVESDMVSNRPWFGQLMSTPQLFAYLIQVDIWLREYKVRIK